MNREALDLFWKGEQALKRLNSNDIARLAGVSRSTVSRVINGYPNVPHDTYDKVMAVIKEHHYYPQLSARMLAGKPTRTLGLFWIGPDTIASDSMVSSFVTNIIDAAAARDYLVLSCRKDTLEDMGMRNDIRRVFLEGRIDAGLFVGTSNNEKLIDELVELDRIVGMFDFYRENEAFPNRIAVNFDRDSGEKTIDYLYALGHRRIAIIDGDMSRASCVHRHESYMRGLLKHDLPLHNKWLCYGGITEPTGYEAAKQMLQNSMDDLPTAICANNDMVALGAYRACAELGLRIPEDISVIGADGHQRGEYSAPPLTTFSFDFRSMFSSLVDRIVDVVEHKEDVQKYDFIPGTLVERGSCRRIERY